MVYAPGRDTNSKKVDKTASPCNRLIEVGWYGPLEVPYYRAIEGWVKRPGSSHRLSKTYDLYGNASVELYVRNE